jgi:hypothetical protein
MNHTDEYVENLLRENAELSENLRRTVEAQQMYYESVHFRNNEIQTKISRLESDNFKLKRALTRMLDFEFDAIKEAKALLKSHI